MKKLLVDITILKPGFRGMGYFTLRLINALLDSNKNKNVKFVFISNIPIDDKAKKLFNVYGHNIIIKRMPFLIYFYLYVPLYAKLNGISNCWFPYNISPFIKPKGCKYILTVYDVIFMRKYKSYTFRQFIGKYFRRFSFLTSRYSVDEYTSCSITSLINIKSILNVNFERSIQEYVLSCGPGDVQELDHSIFTNLGLKNKSYIYTISGNAFHKNFSFLFKSYCKLLSIFPEAPTLVVTGFKKPIINHPKVIFTPYISTAHRNCLIKGCKLFLFLSIEEGFGLPLIESLSLTENIILSDIPVFREIAGDRCHYVNLTDDLFLIDIFKNGNFKSKSKLIDNRNYVIEKFDPHESVTRFINLL